MRRLLGFLILLTAALAAAVVLVLTRRDGAEADSRAAVRHELLERQVRGAEALLAAARSGPLLRFEDVLVTVDEGLVQDLLASAMPVERVVDEYRIRLNTARVRCWVESAA